MASEDAAGKSDSKKIATALSLSFDTASLVTSMAIHVDIDTRNDNVRRSSQKKMINSKPNRRSLTTIERVWLFNGYSQREWGVDTLHATDFHESWCHGNSSRLFQDFGNYVARNLISYYEGVVVVNDVSVKISVILFN